MSVSPVILIVDDEDAIRTVVARIFSSVGWRTLAVANATDALEILADTAHNIVLLLTDLQMPGMWGDQLIARARAQTPTLRVILMTGMACNPQYDMLFRSLGVTILAKPFGERQLIALVKTMLDDSCRLRTVS